MIRGTVILSLDVNPRPFLREMRMVYPKSYAVVDVKEPSCVELVTEISEVKVRLHDDSYHSGLYTQRDIEEDIVIRMLNEVDRVLDQHDKLRKKYSAF